MYPYIMSRESVTVVVGVRPYTVPRTDELVEAIKAGDEDKVKEIATAADRVAEQVAKIGAVSVYNGHVTLNGKPLSGYLVDQIVAQNEQGLPIEPLVRFLERVERNPSFRAKNDLYAWVEASKMPILEDGRFIAYKLVRDDYRDIYSRRFDNSVGQTPRVERNEVDENPDETCSHGLHFCNAAYLPHYGPRDSRVMLIAIDPADVVAFPRDYGLSKGRCAGYEVIAEVPKETAATFFEGAGLVYNQAPDGEDDPDLDFDDEESSGEYYGEHEDQQDLMESAPPSPPVKILMSIDENGVTITGPNGSTRINNI